MVFDIFAIGYMVSIHHRNFKKRPKKRRRFVSTKEQSTDVNDEEYDSDDGTPSVEHVSIYDDSEPSIASGTVAQTSDQGSMVHGSYLSYAEALAGSALFT